MESTCYLLPRRTNWFLPTEAACFTKHGNCLLQAAFSSATCHMSAISVDLLRPKMAFMNVVRGPVAKTCWFQTPTKLVFVSVCYLSH